jgi:hypothetical protein
VLSTAESGSVEIRVLALRCIVAATLWVQFSAMRAAAKSASLIAASARPAAGQADGKWLWPA